MTSIQYSIIQAMSDNGVSQAELSRRSGVSKSSLSRYLNGGDIPASKVKAIADALHVSVDDIFGIGKGPSLSPDERELLDCYRHVEPWEQELIIRHARFIYLHVTQE